MPARIRSWLARPQLFRTLVAQLRVAGRLIREPAVSALTKVIPVLAVLYLVDPLDIVPDVLPVIGQIDDLAVAIAGLETFLALVPRTARAFHEAAIAEGRRYSPMPISRGPAGEGRADAGQPRGSDVIDAEWRRE